MLALGLLADVGMGYTALLFDYADGHPLARVAVEILLIQDAVQG